MSTSNEAFRGVEDPWKQGKSPRLVSHPDYGQYTLRNYFKAFLFGFHHLWAKEKYWCKNQNELPWDAAKPFICECNTIKGNLLDVWRLLLDETMSGFCPHTSKTGGLRNITHKKCKPKDIGTMTRNGGGYHRDIHLP